VSIGRNTGYNIVGALIPLALALLTVPIYLRLVGADRYGVLAIAWLILGYFGLFDLGLGRATAQRIAALRDADARERGETFWTALVVNAATGVVGGALLWPVVTYVFTHHFKVDALLRPEILAAVPLLAASVPVATTTGVLSGALQGRERFRESNIVSVASTMLFQLLPLLVAWLHGPNLAWLLVAALAARIIALGALWMKCRDLVDGVPFRFDRARMGVLLRYGGWVTLTSMFGPVLVLADRFAIGAILGAAAVAGYTIAFQLAQRVALLPTALANALFPRLASAGEQEEAALGDAATRTLASVMTVPVLIAILLMDPFLRLWLGATMAVSAGPIAKVLLIGFWANAFAIVPYARLQARDRPHLVTAMLLLQIPPYLLLLFGGIRIWGLLGAALAFTVRAFADYLLLSAACKRQFPAIGLIVVNGMLLVTATIASERYALQDPALWGAGMGALTVAAVLAWKMAPLDLRGRLVRALPARGAGRAAGARARG
jgi:O-antigen/teichoic acid export membrane protein